MLLLAVLIILAQFYVIYDQGSVMVKGTLQLSKVNSTLLKADSSINACSKECVYWSDLYFVEKKRNLSK